MVVSCIGVKARRIRLQQGSHLIDERTCSAGTDTVHALFHIAVFKIDDLGILAAQFDRHIGDWGKGLQGSGDGNDFLNEGHLQVVGQCQTAGAGDHWMHR